MMTKPSRTKLSIVIPAYNEAETLRCTVESLINQRNKSGRPVDRSLYQIVIVDNNSTDGTAEEVMRLQERKDTPRIILVHEKEKGVVPCRIAGMHYVLRPSNDISTEYLASGDADVAFHPNWIESVLRHFRETGADVLSYGGCFPLSFWKRVPLLVQRYLEDIGTIFFDPPTIDWAEARGKCFLFTEQISLDFVRPVTDGCFAIRRTAYLRAGGYRREFQDEQRKLEVYGEGWRLVFKLERLGVKIVYVNDAFYNSSPRRLLNEPERFLGGTSYQEGMMADIRKVETEEGKYARLNDLAEHIDLEPVQRYIIEYYILLKCVTRPALIYKNPRYFGNFQEELYVRIHQWWRRNPDPEGKDILAFGRVLGDEYFERMLASFPRQRVSQQIERP